MDGLKNLGRVDFPQGEFWRGNWFRHQFEEDGEYLACKQTASAAHIYGKPTASASDRLHTQTGNFSQADRRHSRLLQSLIRFPVDLFQLKDFRRPMRQLRKTRRISVPTKVKCI